MLSDWKELFDSVKEKSYSKTLHAFLEEEYHNETIYPPRDMFGKKKNKSNYYFDSFGELCHFSVQCCEYILNFENHFDYTKLEETKTNVHLIEHAADDKKHEVTAKLMMAKTFPYNNKDVEVLYQKFLDENKPFEQRDVPLISPKK